MQKLFFKISFTQMDKGVGSMDIIASQLNINEVR